MKNYWVMINGKMKGPLEIPELVSQPGFTPKVSVFVAGEDEWKEAIHFTSIVQYLKTGELPPEIQVNELADEKIHNRNWREAVVEADVEYPNVKVSAPPTASTQWSPLYKKPLQGIRATSKNITSFSHKAANTRQGQKALLLLLGLGLYGTYQPAIQLLPTLIDGATSDVVFTPPKLLRRPPPWHHLKLVSQNQKGTAKNTLTNTKPSSHSKVVSVDASDLSDGTVMKTVTLMVEANGIKTYKTKTYVEISKKQRRR